MYLFTGLYYSAYPVVQFLLVDDVTVSLVRKLSYPRLFSCSPRE